MKVNLILKRGAFYFLNSINLMNGQAQEVDLATLTAAEKKGLTTQIKSGLIESSEDILDKLNTESTPQKEPEGAEDKETEEAIKPEAPQEVTKSEDTKETSPEDTDEDRTKWNKNRYKRELNNRKLAYQNTMTIDELAVILELDDEKHKQK